MTEINGQALQRGSVPSGSNAIAVYSQKASAASAATMLDFVREMLLVGEDLSQRQADYWIFELSAYRADLIEKAFHKWVRQSKFMPTPSEIIQILEKLCEADALERRLADDMAAQREAREVRAQLKAAGEPYGLDQVNAILREAIERIKHIPAPPDPNRRVDLKERIARAQAERAKRKPPRAAGVSAKEATA
jgi:hypothetical protein